MNNKTENLNQHPLIQIVKNLTKNNIYLVGGFVRDIFLGKESFDIDLVLENESSKEFSKRLTRAIAGYFVPLDEDFGIYRVITKDKKYHVDVVNPIGKNIIEDLSRRDLTINAIALNLQDLKFLDPHAGIEDIKNRTIRMISAKNLEEDPLRLLRVFRFRSSLGFKIDEDTELAVKSLAKRISESAKERQMLELIKLFQGDNAHSALEDMDRCGILEEVLPRVKELKKVPSNSHHHLNLFEHSIETVRQLQILIDSASDNIKSHLAEIPFAALKKSAYLKISGFLHDIGKPETWTIEEGKHRFIKHDDVGSKLIVEDLKNIKFSNKQIKYIQTMIKNHIYPSSIISQEEVSDKSKLKFIRKMREESIDVILLAMADRLSAQGEAVTKEMTEKNISGLKDLLAFYENNKDALRPLPKLISGTEIMALLNIEPSEELGKILHKLKDAQILGEVNSKEEAIEFIKKLP